MWEEEEESTGKDGWSWGYQKDHLEMMYHRNSLESMMVTLMKTPSNEGYGMSTHYFL